MYEGVLHEKSNECSIQMTKDNISFIHWSAVCIHFEAKEMVQFNTQALDYHFPILNNLCTDP